MSLFTPTSSVTSIYLTSDSQLLYSPSPYIPSDATISPFIPSLPAVTTTLPTILGNTIVPSYTTIQPQFPLVPELDLDNDPKSKSIITDYFYFKTLDKWLYNDMLKILAYLKVSGGNVDFIDKLSDYNPKSTDKDTQESVEKKIKFIEKNRILTRDDIYNVLREFTRETNTKWAELVNKQSHYIKDMIRRKLKHKMEKMIGGKLKN